VKSIYIIKYLSEVHIFLNSKKTPLETKAKRSRFFRSPKSKVREKKRNNSGLVPKSKLTPFTFPLYRKAAISVAFTWRNSGQFINIVCVCSLKDMSCPGTSEGTDAQGQAQVTHFEGIAGCSGDGNQTAL